jgi:hypothetical protein
MKAEIVLRIIDVAGQAPEPAFAKAGPQQRADRGDQQADNHQKFAHVIHPFASLFRMRFNTNHVAEFSSQILRAEGSEINIRAMKLALAVLVYALMATILGAGILLLAMTGKPWLFIVTFIIFVVAFGKIGCKSY